MAGVLDDPRLQALVDGLHAQSVAQEAETHRYFGERAKKGEEVVTHYFAVPEDAFEDPQVMARWARLGYASALRAATRRRPGRQGSSAPPRSSRSASPPSSPARPPKRKKAPARRKR